MLRERALVTSIQQSPAGAGDLHRTMIQRYPDANEPSIVRRASGGDRSALEWIMRRYNRRLYRLARAVLGDHTDAIDAVQEAYLRAFRAFDQFRGESTLANWLERIVINRCLEQQRRSRRRQNAVPTMSMESIEEIARAVVDEAEDPPHRVARAQMQEILQRNVAGLPAPLRVVFVLRSMEELSVQETARYLDLSEEAVRTRHFRARLILREALAKYIDADEHNLWDFGNDQCDSVIEHVLARITR